MRIIFYKKGLRVGWGRDIVDYYGLFIVHWKEVGGEDMLVGCWLATTLGEWRMENGKDVRVTKGNSEMGFRTPRGRQIDFATPDAFAIMGRIWKNDSKRDAYYILRTCEAFDNLPQLTTYAMGLTAAFVPILSLWMIPVGLVVGTGAGSILLFSHLHLIVPGLVRLLRLWNLIPELLRLLLPPLIIAIVFGWLHTAFWLLGLLGASTLQLFIVAVASRRAQRKTGLVLGQANFCFLEACQMCAMEAKVKFAEQVSLIESARDQSAKISEECLEDYARRCPQGI